jgi:hypothetical protein
MQVSQQRARRRPRRLLTLRGTPSNSPRRAPSALGRASSHTGLLLASKTPGPSEKVRSPNGASVGTAALGAVIYSGAGAGFSGDLRAIVL